MAPYPAFLVSEERVERFGATPSLKSIMVLRGPPRLRERIRL